MDHNKVTRHSCPCCGYLTLTDKGQYDICPVCFWEDDPIQSDDEFYDGGANVLSLNEARRNFKRFGAQSIDVIDYVRKPYADEMPTE